MDAVVDATAGQFELTEDQRANFSHADTLVGVTVPRVGK